MDMNTMLYNSYMSAVYVRPVQMSAHWKQPGTAMLTPPGGNNCKVSPYCILDGRVFDMTT